VYVNKKQQRDPVTKKGTLLFRNPLDSNFEGFDLLVQFLNEEQKVQSLKLVLKPYYH